MNHTCPPKDPRERSLYEMWWEREPARATRWETEKICRKATPGSRRRLRNTSQACPSTLSAVVGVPNSTFAPVLDAGLPGSRKISLPPIPRLLLPTFLLEPLQVEGEEVL